MKFPIISDLSQADIYSKVTNYMHEHGFGATLQRIVTCTRDRIIYRESHRDKLRGMQFDNEFGLDTESQIPVEEVDIDGDIVRQKRHYYAPTPISLAKSILEQLDLKMSDYVFIDLGSGKGRVLILAALYPFKQTIGVELDKTLVEIARDNIDRYTSIFSAKIKCKQITVLCENAAEFPIPDEKNLIVYLYNPFNDYVLRPVLANMERRLANGRAVDIIVIYINPEYRDLFDSAASFELVELKDNELVQYAVYRSRRSDRG